MALATTTYNNGLFSFEKYLQELEILLLSSKKQKNPALFLLQKNARTPLFMLEALARMYKNLHNKKRFKKMQEFFKILEDSLGALDYSNANLAYCKSNKKIPKDIIVYFTQELEDNCDALNSYLSDNFFESTAKFEKIKEKLSSAKWLSDADECEKIKIFYKEEIDEISKLIRETKFDDIETDVHELRRQLRWLSIYPQALNGKIQLKPSTTTAAKYTKYLTKDILKSPYNKMPLKGKNKEVVLLNKNAFLALSFIISALGDLKDEGLQHHAIVVAFQNTKNINVDEALKQVDALLNAKNFNGAILQKAEKLLNVFAKEKNLEALLN